MSPLPDEDGPDRESFRQVLEMVLNHVDQGISYFNRDLILEVCNRRFLDLLDFPPAMGVAGTPFEDFIRYNAERGEYGPGDVDELVKDRMNAARKQKAHRFERARPSDGTTLEIVGTPLEGGGFVTTYADITERKRHEAQLEEAQNQLTLALEGADLGMWDWNLATQRIVSNARFKELLGIPADAVIDKSMVSGMLHPDDRVGLRDALSAHFKGDVGRFESEYRLRHQADGRWMWVMVRGKVMARDPEGRALRIVGTMLDITERKQYEALLVEREKRLATLARSLQDMIFVIDSDGKVLEEWPAPGFRFTTGTSSMVGCNFAQFLPLAMINGINRCMTESYWDHSSHGFEFSLDEGEKRTYYGVTLCHVTDASKYVTGFLVRVRDITEVRQLHEALGRASSGSGQKAESGEES